MPAKGSKVPWKLKPNTKLLYGVGINDATYQTRVLERYFCGKSQRMRYRSTWRCPFYSTWANVISRCYLKKKRNAYVEASVCEEWYTFSNFKRWMESQDYVGKHLDKDLLCLGNKVYCPEHCVFISKDLNNFLIDRGFMRGEYPIGVCYHKSTGRLKAACSNPIKRGSDYLGLFDCPQEAHEAWRAKKEEYALWYASQETDERIIKALTERYKPNSEYLQWLNRGA